MNELSVKQISIMIFFIPLVFKMATLPSLLYEEAQSTAFVLVGIMTVIEFLQLYLVLYVGKKGGLDKVKETYGKGVYLLVTLPMTFVMAVKTFIFLHEISVYITGYLFYNIGELAVVAIVLITCAYLGIKGGKSIGRLFEISVWLVPLIIIVGIFFGNINTNPIFITPLFEQSGGTYTKAIGKYLIYMFDFSPLLFMKTNVKKVTPVAICSVLSAGAVMGCYVLLFSVYGNAMRYITGAFAKLASFNTVVSEIGSLDWPSGLLWLTTGMLSVALKFAAVGRIGDACGSAKIGVGVFTAIIAIMFFTVFPTFDKTIEFATNGSQYAVIGIEILLPLVTLTLIYRQKSKEKGELCVVN